MLASFDVSYTALKGNSDIYKNTGSLLPLKICQTLDLAIRQVDRVVNKTHRRSRSSLLTIVGRTTNRPSQPPSFALIFNPLTGYDHDRVGQKRYPKLMATIILSNLNRCSHFFTKRFFGKFVVNWLRIPPHLAYVATLHCSLKH